MTLQERLVEYKDLHKLSATKLAEKLNVNHSTICQILRGEHYTPKIADKIYQALGDEYKQYIKYHTCAVCGEQYVPKSCDSVICGKKECVVEHNRLYSRAYKPKNKRKYDYEYTRKKLIIPDHKPEKNIVEFMSGQDYGDRQREYLLGLQREQRMGR